MKKTILVIVALLFIAALSCKKSASYTPDCSGATPKFSSDVSVLVSSQCAISGCHASGSKNGPGALTTYAEIKNSVTTIRSSVVSGSMPDKGSLSSAQRNVIVCWIDAGANNN